MKKRWRWRMFGAFLGGGILVTCAQGQVSPGLWPLLDVAHVEVNGRVDPTGALYHSPDGRATLVVSGRIGELILLDLPGQTLNRVREGGIRFGEGAAMISDSLRTEPLGAYTTPDTFPAFRVDSLFVRLVPKIPLAGEVSSDSLLSHSPEWAPEMRFYEPFAPAIAALKAQVRGVQVVAVFSTSCGRCRAQVPKLMKVAAEVDPPGLKVRYLVVPGLADATMTAFNVWFVPTIIVLREGKEIGRIVERPRMSMEEDLLAILRGMY